LLNFRWISLFGLLSVLYTPQVLAGQHSGGPLDLTQSTVGYLAVLYFVLAYILVMAEEFTLLRKSKPVILAAGLIWGMIGYIYAEQGMSDAAESAIRQNLLEYAELMLFLLVAMTYISALEERRMFAAIRAWLVGKGFGLRPLFWITGFLAFFISPVADNLTTALIMCAVVLAVGGENTRFVSLACINIVVAANAGGAFSPFGDITTLMVWQKELVPFGTFFVLFLPALANFLVPAGIMHFAIPKGHPDGLEERIFMKRGARRIALLFLLTIITAVCFHNYFGFPPVIGMLTGLAYLQFFGFYLKRTAHLEANHKAGRIGDIIPFDVFNQVARAEWDTLLFFYGVVLCVGGLGFMGYLALVSEVMYGQLSATQANIGIGVLSSIVDNIPVMFSVLTMNPQMSTGQWLLVTMTAGVGGSLLSIGSAAGVALMGQARGKYTFFSHLRWMPAIALGYAASILVHLWLNARYF